MTPLTYTFEAESVFKVKARLNPEKQGYSKNWLKTPDLFVGDCVCLPKGADHCLNRLTALTVIDIAELKGDRREVTFVKLPTFRIPYETHIKICETLECEYLKAKLYKTEVHLLKVRESSASGNGFCGCCGTLLDPGESTLRIEVIGRTGSLYHSPWSLHSTQKTEVAIHRRIEDCRLGFIMLRKRLGIVK